MIELLELLPRWARQLLGERRLRNPEGAFPIPAYYGIAYYAPTSADVILYPMPINVLIRSAERVRAGMKQGRWWL